MGIQIITTPAGEEMVVMSRAEYEALLAQAEEAFEDGADAATYAAALAAQNPEDILPTEVSAMILQGHSRVRAFRKWRSISFDELVAAAQIDPQILAEIELDDRLPDHDVAARISAALELPPSWLAA